METTVNIYQEGTKFNVANSETKDVLYTAENVNDCEKFTIKNGYKFSPFAQIITGNFDLEHTSIVDIRRR